MRKLDKFDSGVEAKFDSEGRITPWYSEYLATAPLPSFDIVKSSYLHSGAPMPPDRNATMASRVKQLDVVTVF